MSSFGKAARLMRTVRHLKPVQITGRLRFRMARPKPDLSPAPVRRSARGKLTLPAARRASMTGPATFVFLNAAGGLDAGWDNPKVPKLWRYNLHYFDDLNADGAQLRRAWQSALIDRWIAENPAAAGSGWEPYPTSLRIVNWVKYSLTGAALDACAEHSLAVQARWLRQRLEWHLLGNHLFVNAKALIFAGCYFEGLEAEGWLRTGLDILLRELPEQLLPDGGQFELSPMYHALMVEDLLDLLALEGAYRYPALTPMADRLRGVLPGALNWLAALSHPDGDVAFFNDSAIGIAPDNAQLYAYAQRLGFEAPADPDSLYLPDSGYLRLVLGGAVLLADLACIGPDYLPGHSHADTLSIELSLGAQRVIVNSGTSIYGLGPERLRQRGTPAHSTVTVAGQDSSEVWSGFRVGRRARPAVAAVTINGAEQGFAASHDGYCALPGCPRHTRRAKLSPTGLWIEDRVTGQHPAQARYHLHPDIEVETRGTLGRLTLPNGRAITLEASAALSTEPGTWHPEFGLSWPNTCLVLQLQAGQATLALNWDRGPSPDAYRAPRRCTSYS